MPRFVIPECSRCSVVDTRDGKKNGFILRDAKQAARLCEVLNSMQNDLEWLWQEYTTETVDNLGG